MFFWPFPSDPRKLLEPRRFIVLFSLLCISMVGFYADFWPTWRMFFEAKADIFVADKSVRVEYISLALIATVVMMITPFGFLVTAALLISFLPYGIAFILGSILAI